MSATTTLTLTAGDMGNTVGPAGFSIGSNVLQQQAPRSFSRIFGAPQSGYARFSCTICVSSTSDSWIGVAIRATAPIGEALEPVILVRA